MNTSKEMKDINFLTGNNNPSSLETNESLKSEMEMIVSEYFTDKLFIQKITKTLITLKIEPTTINSKQFINNELTTFANDLNLHKRTDSSLYQWLIKNFRTKDPREEFNTKNLRFLQENFGVKDHEISFAADKIKQILRDSNLTKKQFIQTSVTQHLDKHFIKEGPERDKERNRLSVFLRHKINSSSNKLPDIRLLEKIFMVSFDLYKIEEKEDPYNSPLVKALIAKCNPNGNYSIIRQYYQNAFPHTSTDEVSDQTSRLKGIFERHMKKLYPMIELNLFRKDSGSNPNPKKRHVGEESMEQSIISPYENQNHSDLIISASKPTDVSNQNIQPPLNQNLLNFEHSSSLLSSSFFARPPQSVDFTNKKTCQLGLKNTNSEASRSPINNISKNNTQNLFYKNDKEKIPSSSIKNAQEDEFLEEYTQSMNNRFLTFEEFMEEFSNTGCNPN